MLHSFHITLLFRRSVYSYTFFILLHFALCSFFLCQAFYTFFMLFSCQLVLFHDALILCPTLSRLYFFLLNIFHLALFYVVIFSYLHVALISCFIFILVAFFHVVLNYVKSVCIRNYSGPHLLAFGLITERYSYLSVFSPNAGQCGPKWLRTWWLFMQWFFMLQSLILSFSILYILYIYMLIKFHLFPVTEKLSLSICIYLI